MLLRDEETVPYVIKIDEYFKDSYEEYPVTICGQTVILTNGKLVAALFKFCFDEQEV